MIAAENSVREEDELSTVELASNVDVKEHGNRTFDAEKVARIKAQIANGEYEIDASRIVAKLIENKT